MLLLACHHLPLPTSWHIPTAALNCKVQKNSFLFWYSAWAHPQVPPSPSSCYLMLSRAIWRAGIWTDTSLRGWFSSSGALQEIPPRVIYLLGASPILSLRNTNVNHPPFLIATLTSTFWRDTVLGHHFQSPSPAEKMLLTTALDTILEFHSQPWCIPGT